MSLPISLSQSSGVPFYRQVEVQLTGLIRAGVLPPGTKLPTVRALAADLAISLITVRKAYAELQRHGLVHSQRGSGTYVAPGVAGKVHLATQQQAREVLLEAIERTRALGLSDDDIASTWLQVFKEISRG